MLVDVSMQMDRIKNETDFHEWLSASAVLLLVAAMRRDCTAGRRKNSGGIARCSGNLLVSRKNIVFVRFSKSAFESEEKKKSTTAFYQRCTGV